MSSEGCKFRERIRQLIKESGESLRTVAKGSGVALTTLADLKNGKTMPRSDTLCMLAKYFNVTTDYLLGLTDARTIDTDLRAAADYTGLSEQAILMLKAGGERYAAALSDFIESGWSVSRREDNV